MRTINTFYTGYNALFEFVERHRDVLFASDAKSILVQVFCGRYQRDYLSLVSMEIADLVPGAAIIGSTTSGEIINGQVSSLKTVISFTIFKSSTVKALGFRRADHNCFELGRVIAKALGVEQAKALVLFAAGSTLNADATLKGIESVNPTLPVSGGKAGSNFLTQTSYILCNGEVIEDGVVGAVLDGPDLIVNCCSLLGWQPIGREMTITKSDGMRVYSIDNIPAFEIYRRYLNLKREDFTNAIEYPLIVSSSDFETAKTPNVLYEDDSIGFTSHLAEGDKVRLSFGNVELISEAVCSLYKQISLLPAEGIFVYSCECRRGFLQDLSKIETEPLHEIATTSGFYTHGEFFHTTNGNMLLNATMTVLVLSETEAVCKSDNINTCSVYGDGAAGRNARVFKALTHLINAVTDELLKANEKLKYHSIHDSLTGQYNRNLFEQEMQRLDKLDSPTGIIICDMDFLKTLNDILGHDVGDNVLRKAARVIAKACSNEGIVARIGGDEFAVLVPGAGMPKLIGMRNKILQGAAEQRRRNPALPLYLSVGCALKGSEGAESMSEAYRLADLNMYQHKSANKTAIRQDIIRILGGVTSDG